MKLTAELVTSFHRALATPEWMAKLEHFITERLRASDVLQTDEGEGTLQFRHTADNNLGPESIVKYICVVRATIRRASGDPLRDRYEASLRWIPEEQNFKLQGERATKVEWEQAKALRDRLFKRMGTPERTREAVEILRHTACPSCAAPLRIEYYPKGQKWWCFCPDHEDHFDIEGHYENWEDAPVSSKDHVADRRCPKCASDTDVVGILYGLMSDPSHIDDTVWILGGCDVRHERWHCRRCKTEW